ncbi:polysaccharide export protein [Diplocarpon rosae]|nr:polysaccharide export protein [Diplocarpon rosae]
MALIPRYFRRKYLRPRTLLLTLAVLLLLDVFSILSSRPAPIRSTTLPPHLKDQKIFIASMFRNSEYMLRLYWNKRLLNLIRHLGPQNVYVSIVESGSLEDTKGALRDLQQELIDLRVEHRIQLGISSEEQAASLEMVPTEGEDRTGWIYTGRAQSWEVRRIPYLAALRNQAMEPLADTKAKMVFDRVLWINDVIFSGSECCLIHADNAQLRREKGVWINPNVRVAYNASAYSKANGGTEIKSDVADVNYGVPGGDGSVWPGRREMITGIWMNRWARWFRRAQIWSEKRVVMSRVRGWIKKGERLDPPQQRVELGLECLINEMQVLFGSGWRHV